MTCALQLWKWITLHFFLLIFNIRTLKKQLQVNFASVYKDSQYTENRLLGRAAKVVDAVLYGLPLAPCPVSSAEGGQARGRHRVEGRLHAWQREVGHLMGDSGQWPKDPLVGLHIFKYLEQTAFPGWISCQVIDRSIWRTFYRRGTGCHCPVSQFPAR